MKGITRGGGGVGGVENTTQCTDTLYNSGALGWDWNERGGSQAFPCVLSVLVLSSTVLF